MTSTQAKHLEAWFAAYTDRFRDADGALPIPLQVKLEHSQRVADNAEGIARDLGWHETEVCAARVLGLLHDVGRFTQYTEFGTLRDPASVNHACRGYEVLMKEQVLADLATDERSCLLEAVRLHNAKNVPEHVSPAALPWLRMIRDADKLDIFHVVQTALASGQYRECPDILLAVDEDGPPSEAFVQALTHRRMMPYGEAQSLADLLLMQVLWVYDLNTPPAFGRILAQDVLEQIAALLPDDSAIRAGLADARAYAQDRAHGSSR